MNGKQIDINTAGAKMRKYMKEEINRLDGPIFRKPETRTVAPKNCAKLCDTKIQHGTCQNIYSQESALNPRILVFGFITKVCY